MEQEKFGDILRTTRERKGLGFADTAERLRIRPDILRAIEESNVSAMPPRGYARNMITGYARYLGLDPIEMAQLYIDALQIYEGRRARVRARMGQEDLDSSDSFRRERAAPSRQGYRRDASNDRAGAYDRRDADSMRTARIDRVNQGGDSIRRRPSRDGQRFQQPGMFESAAGAVANAASNLASSRRRPSFNASGRGRQSRDPMLKANDYVTFFQDANTGLRAKLPFVLAAIIILLLLIISGVLIFGNHSKAKDEVTTLPVTSTEETVQQEPEQVAPTKFTLSYKIDQGVEAWTQITVDDETKVAEVVTGPSEGTFDVTGTLQFVCAAANGVHITIDGQEQELQFDDNGLVNMTFKFSDYLAKWQKDHGLAPTTDSADSQTTTGSQNSTDGVSSNANTTQNSNANSAGNATNDTTVGTNTTTNGNSTTTQTTSTTTPAQ